MVFDENDLKVFSVLSDSLEGLMNKLETHTKEVDSKDKAFILSSINSVKEKINNSGDLTAEIEKLKNYASNR